MRIRTGFTNGGVILILIIAILTVRCTGRQRSQSPEGYDLNQPEKYNMPDELTEISGITFNDGNADTIFAEQDEDGKLFYFNLGSKDIHYTKFGKGGDYEDVAIGNKTAILLRSDGALFTFPYSELTSGEANSKKNEDLLPKGEYEGLYADKDEVYVLCKDCSIEKSSKSTTLFNLKLAPDGTLKNKGSYAIDVKKIEELTGQKKINFHPSGLAKNPLTGEWLILSSVNKMLVTAGPDFKIKKVLALNPAVFHQPEGITFSRAGDLYISNEGDKLSPGNILKFTYKK
ncbi:MAG TPA: SdiA-regulated domain-containing protein [Mucilaginibacter sp.]|nr:SdiA-regulated domain-containing protein [Mucilaginibacter sp.]